jgi:argininosuccinate lyase
MAADRKIPLEKLSLDEMRSVDSRITDKVHEVLGVDKSVRSRVSYGGTAPNNVRTQARAWLKRIATEEAAST